MITFKADGKGLLTYNGQQYGRYSFWKDGDVEVQQPAYQVQPDSIDPRHFDSVAVFWQAGQALDSQGVWQEWKAGQAVIRWWDDENFFIMPGPDFSDTYISAYLHTAISAAIYFIGKMQVVADA